MSNALSWFAFRWPAFRLSLRSVLVWSFVLLIALTGVVTSYLTLRDRQATINQLAAAWHGEITMQVVRFLDANLTKPRLIAQIALDDQQSGLLQVGDFDAIDRYLLKRMQAIDFLNHLLYGDAQNHLRGITRNEVLRQIASDPNDPEQIWAHEIDDRGNLIRPLDNFRQPPATDRPWYRAVAAAGQPSWSPVYLLGSGADFALNFTVPFYDRQQNLIGAVSAGTRFSFVDQFLHSLNLGETGQIFILERSGLLIGCSTGAPIYESIAQNGQPVLQRMRAIDSSNDRIKATSQQLIRQFGSLEQITARQEFNFRFARSREQVEVIPYQDGFGLDWLIVVSVPETTLATRLSDAQAETLWLYAAAIAGAVLLSSTIARQISRPIVQLSRASHALAFGQWQSAVPTRSAIAEINTLATSYQQMSAQLQQSFEQVKAALSTTEAKFAKVFHASPDVITISTLNEGRFLEVSDSFLKMSGYEREEVIGRTAIELGIWADPRDRQQFLQMLLLRETHSFEYRFQTRSGDRIPFLASIERIQIDGQICILTIGKDIRDRKRMEAALLETQRVAHIGSWEYDVDRDQITWSAELFRILGRDPSLGAPSYREVIEQIHPHDAQLVEMLIRRSIDQNEPYECDLRWQRPDGKPCIIEARGEPVTDANGRVVRLVGTALDITDRKNIESALQAQRAYLRQVIDAIPSNLFVKDRAGRYLVANKAIARHYNLPESELLGKTAGEFFQNPALEAQFQAENLEVIASGTPRTLEQLIPTVDGEPRWYQVILSPFRDAEGQTQGVIGVSIDITDRKQIETELEAQRSFLQQIVEVVPSALFVKDSEGRFLLANQAAAAMHGYPVETMVGKTVFELTGDRSMYERYQANNHAIMATRQTKQGFEEEITNSFGEVRWYQTLISPFVDASGQVQGVVGASIDITELRQAREAAQAANHAKSIFLANMSHELRTPLNAILGFTQLMSQDLDVPPAQQDYLNIINASGEHLLQLINDVLSIAKIEAGQSTLSETQFDLFDLLDNLESLLRLRAETKGLQLHCDRALDLPQFIIADAGKLRQVLINLIGNAIKFTDAGQVTLSVGCRTEIEDRQEAEISSLDWPTPDTRHPTPLLHFSITDTGCGIPASEFDRIFEPFMQTETGGRQQGTGLGLAICQRFVQQMGGQISVCSAVEQGSVFTVEVPCQLAESQGDRASIPQAPIQRVVSIASDQPPCRILVVDDTAANRQLLLRWLEPIGFVVRAVESGAQAIEQCAEFAPHLIWMDMRMPGIDGYEATRQIRQQSNVQPKIIAITAVVFEEERQRILAAGCDDFVGKPCTEAIVLEKIRLHLGVRYQYEPDRSLQPIDPGSGLSVESIAVMPIDWIRKLDFAARSANDAQITQLLDQIPAAHASLKAAIAYCVHEFQLERLLEVTQPFCP